MEIVYPDTDDVQQTVGFSDTNVTHVVSQGQTDHDQILQNEFNPTPIMDFLKRPQFMGTIIWPMGSTLPTVTINGVAKTDYTWNPWVEFLSNNTVVNKFKNFRLLKGEMHVKMVINGNPFYYGRAFIAYEPGPQPDLANPNDHGIERLYFQNPHSASILPKVIMDPTQNMSCDLVLPYFNRADWIDLNDVLAGTGEVINMGHIGFIKVSDLDNVTAGGAAAPPINISIYQWMDNIELTMPTGSENFVAESDEYGQGPISKPATVVANVAAAFSDAPIIGPFAKATEIGARAVSSIATLFGFSKPVIVTEPGYMKNEPYSYPATYAGSSSSQKLTLDPKQELSVGNGATGLGTTDDMTIMHIAGTEGYLGKYSWTQVNSPGDVLGKFAVMPGIREDVVTSRGSAYKYDSPMCSAAKCFEYWKGPITYKFVMVASQYHRGRFKITYEPDSGLTIDPNSTNTHYSRIIDLSDTREFEYTVGWGSNLNWKRFDQADFSTSDTTDRDFTNGELVISVVNDLTSPLTNSTVEILVFARAAEGFQVSVPTMRFINNMDRVHDDVALTIIEEGTEDAEIDRELYVAQSGEMTNLTRGSAASEAMTQSTKPVPDADKVYMGETFTSFRSLVKRFQLYCHHHAEVTPAAGTQVAYIKYDLPMYPVGNNGSFFAPYVGGSVGWYNNNPNSYIAYLIYMYAGVRGSTRWHISPGGVKNSKNENLIVHRWRKPSGGDRYTAVGGDTPATNTFGLRAEIAGVQEGGVPYNLRTQTGVSVELPYYSATKFNWCNQAGEGGNYFNLVGNTQPPEALRVVEYSTMVTDGTTVDAFLHMIYVSAGEDFNLTWFLGQVPYKES